jgi:hypothetical protein
VTRINSLVVVIQHADQQVTQTGSRNRTIRALKAFR